ncbi:MAG: MBL fold metallo-hydrolase [Candidatus Aminicenantes bacterium]|nr:MBL fold metallo-hydrolase [Candidatus Aminicenantes bacterium]
MRVTILGTESLGVRGLSCLVEAKERKIVIDPGLALGYQRHGLLPHPFQVAVGERVRRKIVEVLKDCTDIVISHFHGDHIPLANANPYQLAANQVVQHFQKPRLWCKGTHDLSVAMLKRCKDLSEILCRHFPKSEGENHGLLSFSRSVPHGEHNSRQGTVMMTRIKDRTEVFVHASDIQLLDGEPISQILDWKPDILLVSGPPLYLQHISSTMKKNAWQNALRLAREVETLILDHHLLRCMEGSRFLKDLSFMTKHRVISAADYAGKKPLPLEALRQRLYRELPVSKGWHKAYASGEADTKHYKNWRGWKLT